MLQRQGSLLSGFQVGKAVTISLDYAIFASGQFVGPDTIGRFSQVVAEFTAWRTVDSEVQSKLAAGESFDTIAVILSGIASQTLNSSRNPRDWNAQVQASEARLLLGLYHVGGVQAVSNQLEQQLQQPAVLVHR
jgi:hypothetical protein